MRTSGAHMIRITVLSHTEKEVVLKVEGRIVADSVDVLEQEGLHRLGESERLVLDLTGVKFIDDAGIELLKRWSGEQVMLVVRGVSPFLRELLASHGLT